MRHRTVIGLAALFCAAGASGAWAQGLATAPAPKATSAPVPGAASAPARQPLPPLAVYTKDNAPRIPRLEDLPPKDSVKAKVEMSIAGGLPCHSKATQLDGSIYVFAQVLDLGADHEKLAAGADITPRGGRASIKVAGLKAGTKIEVIDENRGIHADEGAFADGFGPLAEHVYKLPAAE